MVPIESIEETVSSTAQKSVGSYCEEGQKQLATGNYVLAVEYFQAAIGANRHDVGAYIGNLILAYFAQVGHAKSSNDHEVHLNVSLPLSYCIYHFDFFLLL